MCGKDPRISNFDTRWKRTASLSGIPTHKKSSSVYRTENFVAPITVTNAVEDKKFLPRQELKSLRSAHTWSF
jgi:hypothetical protein